MPDDRIARQIAFLLEADKLKSVLRRTLLIDNSRQENAAEHSWHLALAAMVLCEHVAEPCDVLHVLELLVVHDLVEIDAGDTFAYDTSALTTKAEREKDGAARVFGLLPPEQGARFRELWEEFEGQHTVESRVANALDRLQPLLLNASSGGGSWRVHDVTRAQVLARMAPIQAMLPALWPSVVEIVDRFSQSGVLREPA
jgi:putative hydrolases of HD superfamily